MSAGTVIVRGNAALRVKQQFKCDACFFLTSGTFDQGPKLSV